MNVELDLGSIYIDSEEIVTEAQDFIENIVSNEVENQFDQLDERQDKLEERIKGFNNALAKLTSQINKLQ